MRYCKMNMFDTKKSWKGLLLQKKKKGTYKIKNAGIIGVSLRGELIGLPLLKNPPCMVITGARQHAKTFLAARMMDIVHHNWKSMSIFLNDIYGHMVDHCKEQGQKEFIDKLLYIKDYPKSLPIVACYPNTTSLKVIDKTDYAIRISINWKEIVENILDFALTTEKNKPMLPPSTNQFYRKTIKDGLKECKDVLEVDRYLGSFNKDDTEGFDKGMMDAIRRTFNFLITERISDIPDGTENQPFFGYSKLKLNGIKYDVLSTLLKANLIPVIITRHVKIYYRQGIIGYWLKKLFEEKNTGYLKGKKHLYFFVDEINDLKEIEDSVLAPIPAYGGNLGIGGVFIGQNYSDVGKRIKQNSAYTFIFKQGGGEAAVLQKELGLSNRYVKLSKLLKPFQCIFTSRDSYFLIFNPQTGEINEETEVPGFVVPPTSMHRLSEGGNDMRYDLVDRYRVLYKWNIEHPLFHRNLHLEKYTIAKRYLDPYPVLTENQDLKKMFFTEYEIKSLQHLSYEELINFGYKITLVNLISMGVKIYLIVPYSDRRYVDLGRIPPGHILLYDLVNDCVCLNGEKAYNMREKEMGTTGWMVRLK